MSKLTNREVLELSAPQRTGKTFFYETLKEIRNYDLQKCVADNDQMIRDEAKKVHEALVTTFGNKMMYSTPEEISVLNSESGIELQKIALKEEQIRAWQPSGDMLYCLKLIQKN